ncbi:hypothetical protein E2C01_063507 [Portunus trituberculatus]|uniref:Uncharacterized protein n=1 Tax=Portunus trituberculatus TaxID=210409 RepID=A0A5B7HKN6_PORTR|nr:hypothetical protein [Portunus trituberculatus]
MFLVFPADHHSESFNEHPDTFLKLSRGAADPRPKARSPPDPATPRPAGLKIIVPFFPDKHRRILGKPREKNVRMKEEKE